MTGGGWTETVLYSFGFTSGEGFLPSSGLVFDSHGNLYGETLAGGTTGAGTIFELSPGSNGTWTEKTLYSFTGGTDGFVPFSSTLAIDSSGNLFGVTGGGGTFGFGTVFELVAGPNGTRTKNILHSFAQENDGGTPTLSILPSTPQAMFMERRSMAALSTMGSSSNLFVDQKEAGAKKSCTHLPAAEGSAPEGGVAFDNAGNIYGNSAYSVFQLVPGSNRQWTENIVHTFHGGTDGSGPDSMLTFDKAGNLYGTTYGGGQHRGTVFELTPHSNGTWTESMLHSFSSTGGDGVFPFFAGLAIDSHGNLFGTTSSGGNSNAGAVFEIVP